MIVRSIRAALAAIALVSVATVTAEAQGSGFGAYGGLALPTGDLSDAEAQMGFQVGAQYSMPLKNALGLRFNADWNRWGLDGVDGSWSVLGAMANLTYNIETGTGLKPYLLGGLGFGQLTLDVDGLGSADESGLMFNIGAGYNFGTRFFTEVRYVNLDAGDGSATYIPIVLGIRF